MIHVRLTSLIVFTFFLTVSLSFRLSSLSQSKGIERGSIGDKSGFVPLAVSLKPRAPHGVILRSQGAPRPPSAMSAQLSRKPPRARGARSWHKPGHLTHLSMGIGDSMDDVSTPGFGSRMVDDASEGDRTPADLPHEPIQLPREEISQWKVIPTLLTFFDPSAVFPFPRDTRPSVLEKPIDMSAAPGIFPWTRYFPFTEYEGPTVRVVVSVDWEGSHLRYANLRAFDNFREAHPEVPLTHFLNAAYFTKSEGQSIQEWSPAQALSSIDEYGLHVHGWKSLVESSGVEFRSKPSFRDFPQDAYTNFLEWEQTAKEKWEETLRQIVSPEDREATDEEAEEEEEDWFPSQDLGEDTDIRAYSVDELRAIISNSKAILADQGLKVGKSFRAGAWLAGPNVLEAARSEGFSINSSAVGWDTLIGEKRGVTRAKDNARDSRMGALVRQLWPDISDQSQPFVVETPPGFILEMPDTGGLADYTTVDQMVDHIDNAVRQLESDSERQRLNESGVPEDRFVHIGFHQENAHSHVPGVIAAIAEIKRKHGPLVVFETLEASARRAVATERLKKSKRMSRKQRRVEARE